MTTPAQLRILHLIALAGGTATPAQIVTATGYHPYYLSDVLLSMQRAGLINRGKGVVWLTIRGMNENDIPTAGNDSTVA